MAIVVCPIRFHDFKVPMKRIFFYHLELNFSVELLQISLKSVGLTVLRSTEIFLLSHHLSNIFIPHSVAFLVFFA